MSGGQQTLRAAAENASFLTAKPEPVAAAALVKLPLNITLELTGVGGLGLLGVQGFRGMQARHGLSETF